MAVAERTKRFSKLTPLIWVDVYIINLGWSVEIIPGLFIWCTRESITIIILTAHSISVYYWLRIEQNTPPQMSAKRLDYDRVRVEKFDFVPFVEETVEDEVRNMRSSLAQSRLAKNSPKVQVVHAKVQKRKPVFQRYTGDTLHDEILLRPLPENESDKETVDVPYTDERPNRERLALQTNKYYLEEKRDKASGQFQQFVEQEAETDKQNTSEAKNDEKAVEELEAMMQNRPKR